MSDFVDIEIPCNDSKPCVPHYIAIGELARRAGVSVNIVRSWVKQGLIPCVRVGRGNRLFHEFEAMEAIEWILKQFRVNGGGQAPPPPPSAN